MPTFAAGGQQTENENVKGGVHIIVNAIADTLGIEGTGGGGVAGGLVNAAGDLIIAAPVVTASAGAGASVRADPVQQAMATTDP